MKDIFKLIIALPFLGFQAGGSVVIGCIGFIFYAFGAICFAGGIYYILYSIFNALQGDLYSIKYICLLFSVIFISLGIQRIYFKIKAGW